ncbi:MAG: virulence factor TspB C-terminal domain-related protein [Acinetobacter sp.]
MHNHVAYSGRKALLKQIFSVFLIFTIYFNAFNSAFASASDLGGWSITSQVVQGASTLINASKSVLINGANVVKTGTALIKPTVGQVAKTLAKGVAATALSVAVEQLLGAVDWVLDPANNQIKYKEKTQQSEFPPPSAEFQYECATDKFLANSIQECGFRYIQKFTQYDKYSDCKIFSGASISCLFTYKNSTRSENVSIGKRVTRVQPIIPQTDERTEKTISLETVAQKVISNAEGGDTKAQGATTAAVADALANDQATQSNVRQQLESSAKTATNETAQGATKPKDIAKPELGNELSLNFPVFCGWAPIVCEAASIAISFPQTLTTWWDTSTKAITESWTWTKERYQAAVTSITDFFKNEPNPDSDNSLPVQDIPLPQLNTGTFKSTPGCPAPIPINITIGTKGTTSISYEPICQFASKWSFVAPLIGFLSAAMILVGVGRKGEDSEI